MESKIMYERLLASTTYSPDYYIRISAPNLDFSNRRRELIADRLKDASGASVIAPFSRWRVLNLFTLYALEQLKDYYDAGADVRIFARDCEANDLTRPIQNLSDLPVDTKQTIADQNTSLISQLKPLSLSSFDNEAQGIRQLESAAEYIRSLRDDDSCDGQLRSLWGKFQRCYGFLEVDANAVSMMGNLMLSLLYSLKVSTTLKVPTFLLIGETEKNYVESLIAFTENMLNEQQLLIPLYLPRLSLAGDFLPVITDSKDVIENNFVRLFRQSPEDPQKKIELLVDIMAAFSRRADLRKTEPSNHARQKDEFRKKLMEIWRKNYQEQDLAIFISSELFNYFKTCNKR